MPWKRGSEKAGKTYDALRAKGTPKDKAAKIAVSQTGQSLKKKGK